MSGLEVVGVVASILQIADLGAKISVKLCSFYRTVKDANHSMQSLSSDVSLTCSILQELGKVLEKDEQTKLCSQQAFHTAQGVLAECKTVFEGIDNAMEKQEQDGTKNMFLRGARKITVAFVGPNLDLLKCNLERLKSTMLLMLNVILYAEQLRQRTDTMPINDNQDMLVALLEEKRANDAKFKQLTEKIKAMNINGPMQISAVKESNFTKGPYEEIEKYMFSLFGLLHEINLCQDSLEKNRYIEICTSARNMHSAAASIMKRIYGDELVGSFEEALDLDSSPTSRVPSKSNRKPGAEESLSSTQRDGKVVKEGETVRDVGPLVTFVVKTSTEKNFTMTLPLSTLVSELKQKLETAEPDKSDKSNDSKNIPADRQRLIYSGRILKDRETLGSYKVKDGHTVHMVGNANSHQQRTNATAQSSSVAASAGISRNSATGVLTSAGLTGARYAGFCQSAGFSQFAGFSQLPGAGLSGSDDGLSRLRVNYQNVARGESNLDTGMIATPDATFPHHEESSHHAGEIAEENSDRCFAGKMGNHLLNGYILQWTTLSHDEILASGGDATASMNS